MFLYNLFLIICLLLGSLTEWFKFSIKIETGTLIHHVHFFIQVNLYTSLFLSLPLFLYQFLYFLESLNCSPTVTTKRPLLKFIRINKSQIIMSGNIIRVFLYCFLKYSKGLVKFFIFLTHIRIFHTLSFVIKRYTLCKKRILVIRICL